MTDENINALPEEHDTGELYYHDHGDGHVHAHTHEHGHSHGHTHTQTKAVVKQAEEKAEEMKGLLTFVKETLGDRVKEVKLSSELGSHPVCMTPAEGMSFEMEKYMKRANPEFAFPVGRVLELNPEHEAVQAMQKAMTEDPVKAKDYAQLLCYQAQLMAQLPIEDPYAYTELVCKLVK